MTATPTPIPNDGVNKAAKTYLWFFGWTFPSLFFITFSLVILVPRTEMMLDATPLNIDGTIWFKGIVGTVRTTQSYFGFISPFVAALIFLPEIYWSRHPRFRGLFLGLIAFFLNFLTLVLLTLIAIITSAVAPSIQ